MVSWVAHALTTDPAGVYHANIFYPQPNALAFSEGNIVEGAIGAPVWVLTKNPYTTHNVVFLFSFAQSFVGAYYLIRHLTGDRRAAVVAGIMYAFCPFAFARQAHIQLMFTGVIPFCMLAWHRLVDRTSVAARGELGVVLWLPALACAYYGIFAGLMMASALWCRRHARTVAQPRVLDRRSAWPRSSASLSSCRSSCPTWRCRGTPASSAPWTTRGCTRPTRARG